MRALWLLFPLVVFGCAPGRQATVSNDGRLASTLGAATSVSGRGRVAQGGTDVAWSPDGSVLAIAEEGGVRLWPSDRHLPNLSGPLAWSPFGDELAGTHHERVVAVRPETGVRRAVELGAAPVGLRYRLDGRLMAFGPDRLAIEDGPELVRANREILDARPSPTGEIAWLELEQATVRLLRWNPETGAVASVSSRPVVSLLTAPSDRRRSEPLRVAVAPDGARYAVAGTVVQGPASALSARADSAARRRLGRTEALALIDGAGQIRTLSSVASDGRSEPVDDLEWSPDGTWLAVARRSGTLRIAVPRSP